MSGGDVSVLLSHHLKRLKLPVFLREYQKVAASCAKEKSGSARFLLELTELELIEREKRGTERRIKEAGFPVRKTLDTFRSEEHTSELQSHSFISYAVFCLKKKKT